MSPTVTVLLLLYSTMVAFRVLKAYRQASCRVTAWEPTKSSLPSFSSMPTACLMTFTVQLEPV